MLPEPVNGLLNGLEPRAITNFFGTPGTGKTNLCMLAAVDCARRGGKVVYIDTEGGFSLERLKQLAPDDYEKVLDCIELVEPINLDEQTKAVNQAADRGPDLAILDSSVALYRVEHAGMNERTGNMNKKCGSDPIMAANRELSKQLSVLSVLARENNIPVIITTHAFGRSWGNGVHIVVGGDPIKYWSKTMVCLEKTGKSNERLAFLVKHRSQPEGKSVKFMLVQDGIKPAKGLLRL